MSTRPLSELLAVDEPAWPLVQQWIAEATNLVDVLPCDSQAREKSLLDVQMTVRSPMGAIVYQSGGLLVDHGWIRILGSGHPRLRRSLPAWNADKAFDAAGNRRGVYSLRTTC